jgi:hypothetical protein
MLCELCRESAGGEPARGRTGSGRHPWKTGRLRAAYCSHCGAALPVEENSDVFLDKLSQLAQFGLTAGAPLLFERSRPDPA